LFFGKIDLRRIFATGRIEDKYEKRV
jgi:hypothetical protein